MTANHDRVGVFGEEGCDNIDNSRERRIETEHHHDTMVKMETSESAKKWFKRKPYEIRSGAGGQENIKSVSSISEGNTENQKRH